MTELAPDRPDDPDVLIVGGGLAGLAAARVLEGAGVDWRLLDAADEPGGRIRTDHLDGFALDRGFGVLLSAYPEARHVLDYDALDLHALLPGALVRVGGAFHPLLDPTRMPGRAWRSLRAPVGGLGDKLRLARLRRRVRAEDPFEVPEQTVAADLAALGFSGRITERFFRPLLGGMLLDPQLGASNRMFRFVMRMFAEGDIVLPSGGLQAIPDQLAAHLPSARLTWSTAVAAISGREATLSDGERVRARQALIIATDGPSAAMLLPEVSDPGSRAATTVYFAAERPPITEPMLVVDGERSGPVNHLCVPSQVAPGYAPQGAALVAASIVDDRGLPERVLEEAVRDQLRDWFGPSVHSWRSLAVYRIPHAQPDQSPPRLSVRAREVRLGAGRYVCGDHRETASIDGALAAGRRAGDAVLADLEELGG